jgi:hypothetical protein
MNTWENEERRKSARYPFREDILIDGTKRCSSMDICEGGMFVSAIQYFEKNSIIDITIPVNEQKVTVKGQVQYCDRGIGMGIQFIELNDEQKTLIKELIERLTK